MNATTTFNLAELAAAANGRKVTAENVSTASTRDEVYSAATEYVTNYTGTFSFLVSLRQQLVIRQQGLNDAQVAGTLNCMIAEYNRTASNNAAPVATTTVTYDTSKQYVADGYYTIVGPKGGHRTVRLQTIQDSDGVKQWLAYLSGSDNVGDYTSIGIVRGNEINLFKKNTGKYQDIVAAARFLVRNTDKLDECGRQYAIRSGKCYMCNRLLTTPESVARGLGPICAAK